MGLTKVLGSVISADGISYTPEGTGAVATNVEAHLRVLDASVATYSVLGIGRNLVNQLKANRRDVYLLVQGDSTGDATTEWVYLLSQAMATEYPAYSVNYRLWSTGTDDYAPPVSISTGTGSNTLYVYNASIPGSSAVYFTGDKKINVYGGQDFDLIIQNYGHNGGTDATVERALIRILESVTQLRLDYPTVEIVLTLQNIDTSFQDFSARQVQATEIAANLLGFGVLDVRSLFRAKEAAGELAEWMSDVVHPNAAGSAAWANLVFEALSNPVKQPTSIINPLSQKVKNILQNGHFVDWVWSASFPRGWTSTTGTAVKEKTINETLSWSVKTTATSASVGSITQNLNSYLAERTTGNGLTFLARIYSPSTNSTNHAGRVSITTSLGSATSDEFPEVHDAWSWRMIYAPPSILDGATTLNLSVFLGTNVTPDVCYIDRVCLVEGRLPSEPSLELPTLAEYYDPNNVKTYNTNAVTVTDDQVVMDSTSEPFASFYIDVYNLVPNETYTLGFTYTGGGTGGATLRGLGNAVGTPVNIIVPLSTTTGVFTATATAHSIEVYNSLPAVPFTLSNITITKN